MLEYRPWHPTCLAAIEAQEASLVAALGGLGLCGQGWSMLGERV